MPEEGIEIHAQITMPGTKNDLTFYVCSGLLEYWSSKSTCKLVVVGDTEIMGQDWKSNIHHQVICCKRLPHHICVWLPDTDVLILLLELVSWGHLGDHTHLKLLTGKGIYYRRVDVVELVWVADRHKCWGFTRLHNLSNIDWARKFVDTTKTTWVGAYMKLYDDDSAMHQLLQISWWQSIPIKLVNGNCHSRSGVQSSLSATQQVPQTLTVTGSQ